MNNKHLSWYKEINNNFIIASRAYFLQDMADADGEMLAEYGAIDAMKPLPQETIGRELDMQAAAEIDEHQP